MGKATRVILVVGVALALVGTAWAGQVYAPYGAQPYPPSKAAPISVAPQRAKPIDVSAQAIVNLLLNPSFETNGGVGTNVFTNWTVVDQANGNGSWYVQTGTVSPYVPHSAPVAPPTDGAFAAMSDQTGPGSHILYQDVAIPAGGAWLKADVYINNWSTGGFVVPVPETLDYTVVPNQHFRIDIMNPAAPVTDVGAGVLRNLFITTPSVSNPVGYLPMMYDLTSFGGQTVRIRFAEVDNQLFFNVGIDNVVLAQSLLIPTLSKIGLVAMALALVAIGVLLVRRFWA